MELEFDILGVAKKLVKYVAHLSKQKKLKKWSLFSQGVQIPNYSFWISKNFKN
jgi:hypothetical protein